MDHQSARWFESEMCAGVTFGVRRMSFQGRMELLRAVRSVSGKQEFLAAGVSPQDQIEAALLEREIDEMYLRWGTVDVRGLCIDGTPATLGRLIECGPEELCSEILARIKRECGLDDEEIKN